MGNKFELWDLFTAKEEYNSIFCDRHQRQPYWLSKNRDIFNPIVSKYLYDNGLRPVYPDNKPFALCITHDIDVLFDSRTAKQKAKSVIKNISKFNTKSIYQDLSLLVKKRIYPDYHISKIINYGKKYNAKSSFYFLS